VIGITNGWCNDGIVKTDMCRQEWLSFLALRMVRNMLWYYDKGKPSYGQDVKQDGQFCDPSEKERNF
jgi:hypothetical protein